MVLVVFSIRSFLLNPARENTQCTFKARTMKKHDQVFTIILFLKKKSAPLAFFTPHDLACSSPDLLRPSVPDYDLEPLLP
jgi:hypothetical protein